MVVAGASQSAVDDDRKIAAAHIDDLIGETAKVRVELSHLIQLSIVDIRSRYITLSTIAILSFAAQCHANLKVLDRAQGMVTYALTVDYYQILLRADCTTLSCIRAKRCAFHGRHE
jgi:hypothetical protein